MTKNKANSKNPADNMKLSNVNSMHDFFHEFHLSVSHSCYVTHKFTTAFFEPSVPD